MFYFYDLPEELPSGSPRIAPQAFFDQTAKLNKATQDFGPFKAVSPAISGTFATSAFFEKVLKKQPVIDRPSEVTKPVVAAGFAIGAEWFAPVRPRQPIFDTSQLEPGKSPAVSTFYRTTAFFDFVKKKQPIIDVADLVKPPLILNLDVSNWFEALRKLSVKEGLAYSAINYQTIPNALIDWFAAIRLRPIPDPWDHNLEHLEVNFITDTVNDLQLPINCVLIGDQLYEQGPTVFERVPGKSGSRTIARTGSGGRLGGDPPSFTVRTDSRGYD